MHATQVFHKRPICAAVQSAIYAMALSASINAQAAPAGGQVVGGTGSISQSGLQTTINQTSQNMAINWQTYNVNQNERVQYIQPNSSSISLNRILSNNGSTIAGRIDANGQVILVNPNGIFFTSTAVVNVGGIIASGLDIKPDDFMNGNYIFNAVDGKDGKVVNTGTINASLGGNVALLGKQVENDGLISANLGTVTLAAGKQAVLTFDNGGVLGVRISKAILQDELGVDPAVLNKGDIKAAGGRVLMTASTSQDVFSQAVNTGDIQQAKSVVVNADGSFTLGDGADVVNTGSVDTSTTDASQNPGQIVMLGNNVTSSGILKADAASGNAGEIELHSTDTTLLTDNSLTSARSDSNGIGGFIKVLGDKVGLFDQSTVDVSGANGGGQALIGGDLHGANSSIQNASLTYAGPSATIFADATQSGNGGKVVVWADNQTKYYANIFNRAEGLGGNGGFTEVSGKQNLLFEGQVDSSSVDGNSGTVLLDPANITVNDCNNGGAAAACDLTSTTSTDLTVNGSTKTLAFSVTPSNYQINYQILQNLLFSNDVVLQATNNITIDTHDVNQTNSSHNLTLDAGSTIDINREVNIGGKLTLNAGVSNCGTVTCASNPVGDISITDNISANAIEINAANNFTFSSSSTRTMTSASTLDIRAGNDITLAEAVTSHGNMSLTSADASLYNNGSGQFINHTSTLTGDISANANITTNGGKLTVTAGDAATNIVGSFSNVLNGIDAGNGAISITTYGVGGVNLGYINSGSLDVATNGNILKQSPNTGRFLNIANGATFNAGAGTILLTNSNNNIHGTIDLTATGIDASGNSISLFNDARGASTLTALGSITSSGNVSVTATRDLSIAGAVDITGNTSTAIFNFGTSTNNSAFTLANNASITAANTVAGSVTVNGNTGNDTFSLGTMFTGTLNGGGGFDTLQGPDPGAGNTSNWTISGSSATPNGGNGTLEQPANGTDKVSFNDFAELDGSTGNDAFTVNADVTTGLIFNGGGGSGTDTLTLASTLTSVPTVTALSAIPGNLSTVIPATGSDNFFVYQVGTVTNSAATPNGIFYGPEANATWDISTSTVSWGSSNSINFQGFITLNGGNSGNTFNVNAPESWAINAGSGGDTFNITSNYTGTITGGSSADTFNINSAGINVTSLVGSGNNDTIHGPDNATTNVTNNWSIDNAGGGSLTNLPGVSVTFTNMHRFTGGNGTDIFAIAAAPATAPAPSSNPVIVNGGAGDNTLQGLAAGSIWNINGANSGYIGTDSTHKTFNFNNMQNLTGGAGGADIFNFYSGSIAGLIDGGNATGNIFNDSRTTSGPGISVKLYLTKPALPLTSVSADINLYQVATINGQANGSGYTGKDTLLGPDASNTWKISDINSGFINATDAGHATPVQFNFTNFPNLTGGSQDDNFYLTTVNTGTSYSELVTGLIDGGVQANQDTLTLYLTDATTRQNTQIKLGGIKSNSNIGDGYINVTGVELLNGNSQQTDGTGGTMTGTNPTLIAADTPNNWDITSSTLAGVSNGGVINNGTTNQVTFSNFSKVKGGNNNDKFKIASDVTSINYSIDGGSEVSADSVDYSAQSIVSVTYDPNGSTYKGISNIEKVIGNGTNSTLIGPDTGTTTWTVDSLNGGNVSNSNGNATLAFSGFNYLAGGKSNNKFDVLAGGALQNTTTNTPGMILGGASNGSSSNPNWNHLAIDLTGGGTTFGFLDFIGNSNVENTITINNATTSLYDVSYSPSANVTDAINATNNTSYQQLNFTYSDGSINNNTGFTLNYKNLSAAASSTDFVHILQPLNTVTVNQAGGLAGNILLSSGQTNSSGLQGSYFSFGANSPVYFDNATNLTAITANATSTITLGNFSLSGTLTLQNGAITQSGTNPLSVGTLALVNMSPGGAINLNTDVANLSLDSVQRDVSITQTGMGLNNPDINVTAVNMANPLTVNADGNISFTGTGGANNQLNLIGNVTSSSVTVNNSGSTNLGKIAAADLTVVSTGAITNSDQISSGTAANFNASGNDILLTNSSNDFKTIGVNNSNSGTVDIVDATGIGLLSLNGGSVSITTGGAITDANNGGMNISANSVTLNAKNGIGGGGVNYTETDGFKNVDFTGAIHTATSNLSVINQNTTAAGVVNIDNTSNVKVTDLRNNGDIVFKNSGTINLDGSKGAITADYPVENNSNSLAGITTFPGSIAIYGNNANSLFTDSTDKSVYDIVAENLLVRDFVEFGTSSVPIRMLVHNQATLIATTGGYYFPYPPNNLTKLGDLKSISGFSGLAGQQLIDIESLGDVDPAIFTKVRNYNHEDVAILMPEDQRLDDDECTSDNKKKCKKQQTMN